MRSTIRRTNFGFARRLAAFTRRYQLGENSFLRNKGKFSCFCSKPLRSLLRDDEKDRVCLIRMDRRRVLESALVDSYLIQLNRFYFPTRLAFHPCCSMVQWDESFSCWSIPDILRLIRWSVALSRSAPLSVIYSWFGVADHSTRFLACSRGVVWINRPFDMPLSLFGIRRRTHLVKSVPARGYTFCFETKGIDFFRVEAYSLTSLQILARRIAT